MGSSGAETTSISANIFVGQTEAPLVVKPFISKMTKSELMAIMVGGFATVAGGVMALNVSMLGSIDGIAGHLLAASIMSAPAALVVAKIMYPETDKTSSDDVNLSSNLNEMLDRLDSLMTNMKQVTDNIAHDLRTPLNRIRTNLEVTLMSNSDVDQYKKSIDDAIIETDNLIKTFNSILSISKVESGASDLDKSVININDLIMNLFDLYEPITDAKGIILNHDVDEEIKIEANNNLLSQAIANLIENSINYGSSNDAPAITIGAKKNKESVSLWVSDNGVGIQENDKKKVLERFVRLDSSRSLKGSGLGLNLVNSAAKFHNGSLKLLDAKPSGLIVLIEIPNS